MESAVRKCRDIGARILDTLLPPRCVVTGEIVDAPGMLSPAAWVHLNFIESPRCATCGLPFEYDAGNNAQCGKCLADPPPFDKVRAVFVYDDASRNLILKFKHGDQTHIAPAFARWLVRAGDPFWPDVDIVAPVPLHRLRLWTRRYNQAALLSREVAIRTGKPHIPDLLERRRATPSQKGLSADQRRRNVSGAFHLRPAHSVKGKTVLLIDDVYTSGATLRECTKVLRAEGANKIYALALAQVI